MQDYGVVDIANMGAAMAPAIDIIGLCGMILPRISNTKIYLKGGKYSINNVCKIQKKSAEFADFFIILSLFIMKLLIVIKKNCYSLYFVIKIKNTMLY